MRGLSRIWGKKLDYIAYLDEFGHIGPFITRADEKHNDSPVFGLAGIVLPMCAVRSFGTWFFKRKYELLKFEIDRSAKHPASWEKKGASLYTKTNVEKYRELRNFTNRFLKKIENVGGFVFYVGVEKRNSVDDHDANKLHYAVLREAVKRLDQFCDKDCEGDTGFFLALDEHDQRSALITAASISMYGGEEPRKCLIEPPFHLESHRFQTIQAADWVAGLVGRLQAYDMSPEQYAENEIFSKYFGERIKAVSKRSSVRKVKREE